MGRCWGGISTEMGQVLCFHVTSAQKTQFTGEGNSVKNHLKKLRGRETIYLAGLEAVGITSANVPICFPPILGRVVPIRSCKGKQEEEPKHGVREFGLIPCCYSHLWLALGQASSLMPSIRSVNNCFPPLRQQSALMRGPHIYCIYIYIYIYVQCVHIIKYCI